MKGLALIVFLLSGFPLFANLADTTVTSFEIYLRRHSDTPIGFNTCSIDRLHIYNLVMTKLSDKLETKNFQSLHNPLVLMKFHDVSRKNHQSKSQITEHVRQSLKGHRYNYFIKIYGNLDIDRPLNQHEVATFTLRVYIFDQNGNLVGKSKSRSRVKNLEAFQDAGKKVDERFPVNEKEFFDLVTDAADTMEIGI